MDADALRGRKVRDYVIQEEIGQGGMAVVYRAFQPSINRHVALKVMRLDKAALRDDFRERFAREAEVIAALEHIHILPVYDYGIENDIVYLAMRYLKGGSLRDLIADGPVGVDRAAGLFSQIASGLAYAHRRGVIHRDVKPSNILLDDAGNAFLTDFGLAKWVDHVSHVTEPGTVMGTLAYISPEQLMGVPIDHRADLYSLGIVLYDMLVGRPPFDASTSGGLAAMLYQHLNTLPPPPSEINVALPPEVDEVVLRALEKKPAARYDSADQMAEALNEALGRSTTSTSTRIRIRRPPLARQREKLARTLALLGAILAVGILILWGYVWWRAENTPFRPPTVLVGEQGSLADLAPSEADIITAQRRLGPNGFLAYLACNLSSEYHAGTAREITEFAADYSLPVRVYDSDSNAYRQITELERARADGARGIMICLLDASLMDHALTSAQEAGLPLVISNPGDKLYGGIGLASDEFELGRAAGRYAGQIIRDERGGQARVIVLDYPSLPSIVQRADGIEAGILELAPGATIVGRYPGGTVENGKESVSELIADSVAFDVIASINDAGAFGAIEALEEAGFAPDSVAVVGIDAEVRALEYIREGYFMRGSVPVARSLFSQAAVNGMVMLLAGKTVPERIYLTPGEIIAPGSPP